MTADEARQLAARTKHALTELEGLLTTDEQRAAAVILHRRLRRVEREIAERWAILYPSDFSTFSTGDKPDEGGDD